MHTIIKCTKQIGFLTVALTLALMANFVYGQWADPTANPTGGNVSLPLNTSTDSQTKEGNLTFSNNAPTIKFNDTDERDFWFHANTNRLHLLVDRDGSGAWNGWPYPFMIEAGAATDGSADYATFANQVRGQSFCDHGGGNCTTPAEIRSAANSAGGPSIQAGTVGAAGGGGDDWVYVAFPTPYPYVPNVVVIPNDFRFSTGCSNNPNFHMLVHPHGVTQYGFTLRMYGHVTCGGGASDVITASWIAF